MKARYTILILLALVIGACSSPQKLYEKGRYGKAVDEALELVRKGKADDRANDPDVIEKKNAGYEWARFANDSGDATATWHYLFATETAIKQAGGTWTALKNFAEWE